MTNEQFERVYSLILEGQNVRHTINEDDNAAVAALRDQVARHAAVIAALEGLIAHLDSQVDAVAALNVSRGAREDAEAELLLRRLDARDMLRIARGE